MTQFRKPVTVLGISGSLREGSYNTGLLHAATELLPEGMNLEIFDLAPIPMFNQDLEADPPRTVMEFKSALTAADGILIATPEYNYSIPGILKNAVDWASRPLRNGPLNDKPLAIIGAGGRFGTTRAQLHLRQIAAHLNMHTLMVPEVLVQFPWEKFDRHGNLTHGSTRRELVRFLEMFYIWILRLQPKALPAAQI